MADDGGFAWGCYVVIDRVLRWRTAWRIHVALHDSHGMTQERLDRLHELVAGENERWRRGPRVTGDYRSAAHRAVVMDRER